MTQSGAEPVYRGDLRKLLAKIEEERGIDLMQYRLAYVERRVAARLRSLNLHTYRQYARYLDGRPDEYSKLLDTLTINVTDFFRDSMVYDFVRSRVLPEIIEAKDQRKHRMLRVWSAGCATGEETYSLAISLLSALGANHGGFVLSVFGTDLDPEALVVAKKGVYPLEKLEHVPKKDRHHYLEIGPESFRVAPVVRSHVRFRQLNLFTDAPLQAMDLIFCRNVFIYFTREQQAKVLEGFHGALSRNGYLVLGRSEKMAPSIAPGFEAISGRDRVYRKR